MRNTRGKMKEKKVAKKRRKGNFKFGLSNNCEGCKIKMESSAGECPQCGSILCEKCVSNERCSACGLSMK